MQPKHNSSSQERKSQWIKFIGLLLSVVTGIVVLVSITHRNNSVAVTQNEKLKFETPLLHVNDGSVILEKAQKSASDAGKKATELEQKLADISQSQAKMVEEIQHRMDMIEKNVQGKQQDSAMMASMDPLSAGHDGQNSNGQMIRRDKLNLSNTTSQISEKYRKPVKNPDTYVPAGTFVQGVIIEGADASAAVTAQTAPEPMLIRLTANGTLPNRRQSHLKDCTVTLAASGDISSERGKIRTERLSCVKPDGRIIEIKVEGNIAGADGKNGMRGNPVWRENALLQRAFTAGALSGLSEGISQTYTTNSISPLGATQTTNNGKILQVGAARGTGKAMDKLADYNIQRAEQYHPVIQLSAGSVVDVVFLEGFYLDGKKHNDNEDVEVESKTPQSHTFFSTEQNTQLPLTPEQVARIDARSAELGLNVKQGGG